MIVRADTRYHVTAPLARLLGAQQYYDVTSVSLRPSSLGLIEGHHQPSQSNHTTFPTTSVTLPSSLTITQNAMARQVAFRQASRFLAASIGPCTCISAAALLRPAIRLDSIAVNNAPRTLQQQQQSRSGISTKAARQISTGSLAGTCPGLPRASPPSSS